jgi:hypothetical protein
MKFYNVYFFINSLLIIVCKIWKICKFELLIMDLCFNYWWGTVEECYGKAVTY